MNKLEQKIKELNDERLRNQFDFNNERKGRRNVVKYQDDYFKKQDLIRSQIEKYERQNLLYNDLKELGIIKEK